MKEEYFMIDKMTRLLKSGKNNSSAWDRTWPLSITIEGIQNNNYSNPSTPLSFSSDVALGSRLSPTCSFEENNNQKSDDIHQMEIRVLGDWSIRQLIATIVEKSDLQIDWSDYALWWPAKKIWLHSMKSSLEQYEIHAKSELFFTPMHKVLHIMLPDHKIEKTEVDFSVPVVQAVSKLASKLGIGHFEEISFSRPINEKMIRRNFPDNGLTANELQRPSSIPQRQCSTISSSSSSSSTTTRTNSPGQASSTLSTRINTNTFGRQSNQSIMMNSDAKSTTLSISTNTLNRSISNMTMNNSADTMIAKVHLRNTKTMRERARLNSTWLNSSRSLYEQDVNQFDLLDLRYKYLCFAKLNQDLSRIHYIYEQLRWSVINEEIIVEETDVFTLAAISLQIASKSGMHIEMKSNATTNVNNSSTTNVTNNVSNNNLNNTNGHYTPLPSVTVEISSPSSHVDYYSTSRSDYQSNLNGEFNNNINNTNSLGTITNGITNGMISGGNNRGSYSSNSSSPTWPNEAQIDLALNGLERSLDKSNSSSSPTMSFSNGSSTWSSLYHNNNNNNNNHHHHHHHHHDDDDSILLEPKLLEKLKITRSKLTSGSGTMRKLLNTTSEKTMMISLQKTIFKAYRDKEMEKFGDLRDPVFAIDLRKCEVQSCVQPAQSKFEFTIIELIHKTDMRMKNIHYRVRCKDEKEYAKWFVACLYATSGKTMAHENYLKDVSEWLKLLQIQSSAKPTTALAGAGGGGTSKTNKKQINSSFLDLCNIDLSEYVPRRILKKKSREQICQQIQALHHSYTALSAVDAQREYIKTVQNKGKLWNVKLFLIKTIDDQKEKLLGISPEKIYLYDLKGEKLDGNWSYKDLYDWKVNWEVKQMCINFRLDEGKKSKKLEFDCISADCKIIHEFIGGYIYMSIIRTKNGDVVQPFDLNSFLKLTGDQEDVEPNCRQNHIDRENIKPFVY